MTTSSSTPSPAIRSRLIEYGITSLGVASGWITDSGCGSKVSTVSLPRMTSRWPTCTPSKVPMATLRRGASPGGRLGMSGRRVTFTARTLRRAAARGREARRWPPARPSQVSRTAAGIVPSPRSAGTRAPWAAIAASSAPSGRSGMNASACASGTTASASASSSRNGPIAVRSSSLAVGVAEPGDQLAHVGARRAFDLECGVLAIACLQFGTVYRRPAAPRPPAARRGGPSRTAARRPPARPSTRAGAA